MYVILFHQKLQNKKKFVKLQAHDTISFKPFVNLSLKVSVDEPCGSCVVMLSGCCVSIVSAFISFLGHTGCSTKPGETADF